MRGQMVRMAYRIKVPRSIDAPPSTARQLRTDQPAAAAHFRLHRNGAPPRRRNTPATSLQSSSMNHSDGTNSSSKLRYNYKGAGGVYLRKRASGSGRPSFIEPHSRSTQCHRPLRHFGCNQPGLRRYTGAEQRGGAVPVKIHGQRDRVALLLLLTLACRQPYEAAGLQCSCRAIVEGELRVRPARSLELQTWGMARNRR